MLYGAKVEVTPLVNSYARPEIRVVPEKQVRRVVFHELPKAAQVIHRQEAIVPGAGVVIGNYRGAVQIQIQTAILGFRTEVYLAPAGLKHEAVLVDEVVIYVPLSGGAAYTVSPSEMNTTQLVQSCPPDGACRRFPFIPAGPDRVAGGIGINQWMK